MQPPPLVLLDSMANGRSPMGNAEGTTGDKEGDVMMSVPIRAEPLVAAVPTRRGFDNTQGAENAYNKPDDNSKVVSGQTIHGVSRKHIAWRGGLNLALARTLANDYGRLRNPPAGIGKLAIYKEWGQALGVAHLDPDGSRVRKGSTRLIKSFDTAHALLDTRGWKDVPDKQGRLRMVCPEYFVLVPTLRAKDWPWHYLAGHYGEDPYTHRDSEIAAAKTQKRQRNEPQTQNNKQPAPKTGAYQHPARPPKRARAEATSYGSKPAGGSTVGDADAHGVGGWSAAEHATNLAVNRAHRKFAPAIPRTEEPAPHPTIDPESIAQAPATGLAIQPRDVNHDAIVTTDTASSRNYPGDIANERLEVLLAKAEVLRMTAFLQEPDYWKNRHQQDREYETRVLAVREKEAEVARIRAEAMLLASKAKSEKVATV